MQTSLSTPEINHSVNWVKSAISSYRLLGREIILAEVMNRLGRYGEDSHYIFALDLNGDMLAHPVNRVVCGEKLHASQGL